MLVLIATSILQISKFHLLWFVPLFHLYGTRWIETVYFRYLLKKADPQSALKKLNKKDILQRKTSIIDSEKSPFMDYPLLALYFDNMYDMRDSLRKGYIAIAKHEIIPNNISRETILNDEELFKTLYDNNQIKIMVNDGFEISRKIEDIYRDYLNHPEKLILDNYDTRDKDLAKSIEEDLKEISKDIDAIKVRFDLESDYT